MFTGLVHFQCHLSSIHHFSRTSIVSLLFCYPSSQRAFCQYWLHRTSLAIINFRSRSSPEFLSSHRDPVWHFRSQRFLFQRFLVAGNLGVAGLVLWVTCEDAGRLATWWCFGAGVDGVGYGWCRRWVAAAGSNGNPLGDSRAWPTAAPWQCDVNAIVNHYSYLWRCLVILYCHLLFVSLLMS